MEIFECVLISVIAIKLKRSNKNVFYDFTNALKDL